MSATTGPTPPSCAWPKASVRPWSARNLPSAPLAPSETTTRAEAVLLDQRVDLGQEALLVEVHLGEQDDDGQLGVASEAKPPAAAIQPAWRPMTSSTNTLVEVAAMERTSKLASRVDTAMYLATDPKPGQLSVMGRSLSTVLGTWMAWRGAPMRLGELRDLEAGVGGVAAAVVEEVADVVGLEDLDEPLVLAAAVFEALELVAARPEGAGGRVAQGGDGLGRFV